MLQWLPPAFEYTIVYHVGGKVSGAWIWDTSIMVSPRIILTSVTFEVNTN